MTRAALVLLLAACLAALEYDPRPGQVAFYRWTTEQRAEWESAGDRLRYDTRIVWDLGLRCAAREGDAMTLALTFIRVVASHRGPATDIAVDSSRGTGADDPLLGHLHALAGQTLELVVARASGAVREVRGTEGLLAALHRRAPAAMPGDPPPLAAQAEALWGPAAWARLWSQVLALPGPDTVEPLPAPFTAGALRRRWQGERWQVELAPGEAAFQLAGDPTPAAGRIVALAGAGEVSLRDGLPGELRGRMSVQLEQSVLTQPVVSRHEIAWTLAPLER